MTRTWFLLGQPLRCARSPCWDRSSGGHPPRSVGLRSV